MLDVTVNRDAVKREDDFFGVVLELVEHVQDETDILDRREQGRCDQDNLVGNVEQG